VVHAYDPEVPPGRTDPHIPSGLELCADAAGAVCDAQAVVLATAWPEFLGLDWEALCAAMPRPVIVDGRNALKDVQWPHGVLYRPIGRRTEV